MSDDPFDERNVGRIEQAISSNRPVQLPSFKVQPVYLSPEHARQVERFTGCPYDPVADAKLQGWIAFKRWDHQLQLARERQRLTSILHALLRARLRGAAVLTPKPATKVKRRRQRRAKVIPIR